MGAKTEPGSAQLYHIIREKQTKNGIFMIRGSGIFLICVSFCTRFPSNKVKVPEHQTRKEG